MVRTKEIVRYRKRPVRKESFSRQIARGIIRLIVVAVVIVGVYHFTRLEMFNIKNIYVEGGETIAHEALRARVEHELTGTYLGLVPKRFTYMYPHDSIVKTLAQTPRIQTTDVSRSSRTDLSITFEEYTPHALWCLEGGAVPLCYFLAETGYAFDEAPNLQGGAFIRHFSQKTDERLPGQVIEEETFRAINAFIEQAESVLGFRISMVTHMPERDISFSISGGGTILASLNRDLLETLEDIAATLHTETFTHVAPGNFQYIDARFENKLFINEQFTATSTATGTLSE